VDQWQRHGFSGDGRAAGLIGVPPLQKRPHRPRSPFNAANLSPFIPPSVPAAEGSTSGLEQPLLQLIVGGAPSSFGVFGVLTAASLVFFAFIGFDIVATAAEETRNPKRDLPRAIIGSLVIVTVLYVLVTVALTAMVPYDRWARCSRTAPTTVTPRRWPGRSPRSASTGPRR
jgi:amino acid transporter